MNKIFTAATLAVLTLGFVTLAGAESSPRDAASGQATGKRQHKPMGITKELDKGSPAAATAETDGDGAGDAAALEHGVKSPRDAASGQATGKRQHMPVRVATGDVDGDGAAAVQDHNSSRSNKSASVSNGGDIVEPTASAAGVKSPRDAASGQATGKRQHTPVRAGSPDLDADNDGVDAQGMAINEKGMPGNTTKAKAGKTGSAK